MSTEESRWIASRFAVPFVGRRGSGGPHMAPSSSRWILFVVVLGTLMVAVDTTIVLLAFPTITGDLHAPLATVIWTILIYLLLTAILTTQLGRVGDLFGRGRVYNLGFVVFTVGSALCGFAPTATSLVAFRAVQAIGGAFLAATGTAIISAEFPVKDRGYAFGYTTMAWSVGATLGIVLGGLLTTFVGWRYIFFINLPIGAVAIALGLRYLEASPRAKATLDLGGMVLLAGALSLLAYGATDFASYGLDAWNGSLMVAGAALVGPFVLWERRARSPMLNLRLFRSRLLSASLAASFFQSLGYLSVVFLLIMYLQGIRGLSPLVASLLLVPGYVVSSGLSPTAGRWADRWGAWRFATLGIGLMIAGVLLYAQLTVGTPLLAVALITLVTGVGAALFWPSNNKAVMHDAPAEHYGSVSGVLRALTSVGTIGSYVLVITVAASAVPRYVAFQVFVGAGGLIGAVSTAFLGALHLAFYVMAGVLGLALVFSTLRRSRFEEGLARGAAEGGRGRPTGPSE
jgi:EmrB/QacA subfamily drug resistance transporter